ERLPRGGQAHAASVALEQLHARLRLQRRDLLRDGRLGVGQRLRGGGERAALGDLAQDPQAARAKHQYSLYQKSQSSLVLMAGSRHHEGERAAVGSTATTLTTGSRKRQSRSSFPTTEPATRTTRSRSAVCSRARGRRWRWPTCATRTSPTAIARRSSSTRRGSCWSAVRSCTGARRRHRWRATWSPTAPRRRACARSPTRR